MELKALVAIGDIQEDFPTVAFFILLHSSQDVVYHFCILRNGS